MIKAWSSSRLSVYETCPQRAKLQCIDRIKEPDRGPPPKGLKEWHNDRGTRIHDYAEDFVRGNVTELIPELKDFKHELEVLRTQFKDGNVILEQMWCYNDAWQPVGDRDFAATWLRVKLDALLFLKEDEAVVIDYKTGKKFGNEVKHAEQCQLYTVGAFQRYPKLEIVHTELWYTDQDHITSMTFTRKQGLRFLKGFDDRGKSMTRAVQFPAKANKFNCKWCPYGPKGTGHCAVGVQD